MSSDDVIHHADPEEVRRRFTFIFGNNNRNAFRGLAFSVKFNAGAPRDGETEDQFAMRVAHRHFPGNFQPRAYTDDEFLREAAPGTEVAFRIEVVGEDDSARYVVPVLTREIRPDIKEALDDYADHGRELGGFLQAVLANDLVDAVCRADAQNLLAIKSVAQYVYNDLPSGCHGSREAYKNWIATRAAERATEGKL